MADFSLRNLSDETAARLRAEAKLRGMSVNALIRQLVEEGIGGGPRRRERRYDDLDALAGTWSAAEVREVSDALEVFSTIDPELWK